jgi:hypothetical protein
VLADFKVVGRILETGSRFDPPDLQWTWSITGIVPARPGVTDGTAATRKEVMAKFRASWEKAKASGCWPVAPPIQNDSGPPQGPAGGFRGSLRLR